MDVACGVVVALCSGIVTVTSGGISTIRGTLDIWNDQTANKIEADKRKIPTITDNTDAPNEFSISPFYY